MKIKEYLLVIFLAFGVIFGAQTLAIYVFNKSNNVSKFDLSATQIVGDLEGRTVSVIFNQIWPFDNSQNINLKIISKKQLDEYVVVIVDINALATVQQDNGPKEKFSTVPTSKEPVKLTPKLPSKLQLAGKMKLTYELVDNDWYLLAVDNLSLKASPIN